MTDDKRRRARQDGSSTRGVRESRLCHTRPHIDTIDKQNDGDDPEEIGGSDEGVHTRAAVQHDVNT